MVDTAKTTLTNFLDTEEHVLEFPIFEHSCYLYLAHWCLSLGATNTFEQQLRFSLTGPIIQNYLETIILMRLPCR